MTEEVPSPCTNVCQIDPHSGYCLGCKRTVEEIAVWLTASPAERRAILARLPARQPGIRPSRP
ncbi:MAG: DUF1289 domain-containing protein [Gammaproteobacteria bacterium]|nr:DUF1289 domain-containing protein [Gammaproteobacteria bacterium]